MNNMFNFGNNSGNNPGSRTNNNNNSNNNNNRNNPGFQRRFSHNPTNTNNANSASGSASNNPYHNLANSSTLVHGAAGLLMASSQVAQRQQLQQNPSPQLQTAQNQALAQEQRRLLQMTNNELEVQQIANNIKESMLIKQRLESIQHLQQQEANKLRAELQMKAAAQQAAATGSRGRNISTGTGTSTSMSHGPGHGHGSNPTKTIPSNSNSSVFPTKQREDERTKMNNTLSTLAETAVAIASASASATSANARSRSNNNIGMMGIGNIIHMNNNNNNKGNNQIAALLGRQASSSSYKKGLTATGPPSAPVSNITSSITNNVTMDALRRDINATHHKLHVENNYKRSLDEITSCNTTTAPSPSSWLWNSATAGNINTVGKSDMISMNQLRAQHQQLQRRKSLPTSSSTSTTSSEFASPRALKIQRIEQRIERQMQELHEFNLRDSLERMRQLDTNMNMNMNMNMKSSLLAQMAASATTASSTLPQERRLSLASSVASAGTTATAPNLTTRNNPIVSDGNFDERSLVLNKLSQMSGGFPMPKFAKKNISDAAGEANTTANGSNRNIPAEITPETSKDSVDVAGSGASSSSRTQRGQYQLQHDHQSRYLERIGGFPMPPLYKHNSGNDNVNVNSNSSNEAAAMVRDRYDGLVNNESYIQIHNSTSNKASRPPSLNSYKRIWRDIRVVAGDDPKVDERLRKEVFARKLQRGEIFFGNSGNSIINNNSSSSSNNIVQQRRLSGVSHNSSNSSSSNNNNNGGQTKSGTEQDESIVI